MSEEPEVSPLRLKRPGAGGPPPPVPAPTPAPVDAPVAPPPQGHDGPPAPVLETPPPASDTATPERLRRRPTLAADNPVTPAQAVPAPIETERAPAPPPPSPPAPPVFKLKVGTKSPPPLPTPVEAEPPLAPPGALEPAPGEAPLLPLPGFGSAGAPLMPLPVPVPTPGHEGAGPAAASDPAATRAPIHLRAEAPAEALDPSKLPPPLSPRAAKAALAGSRPKRDAMFFGLVFLLVVGAGAGAYFYLAKPEAAKEAAGDARQKLEQAAQLTSKAVNDAKQALVGARDKEQARVDAVLDGKEPSGERAVGNVTPGELQLKLREKNSALPAPAPAEAAAPSPAPVQAVTAYAGGAKPAVEASAAPQAPQPSAKLLRYAEGIHVTGVFQGTPARALIDGRLVREGELVDPALGIKFADVDPQAKQLVLEEGSGARVRVRY